MLSQYKQQRLQHHRSFSHTRIQRIRSLYRVDVPLYFSILGLFKQNLEGLAPVQIDIEGCSEQGGWAGTSRDRNSGM
jgi:hypothetical protein